MKFILKEQKKKDMHSDIPISIMKEKLFLCILQNAEEKASSIVFLEENRAASAINKYTENIGSSSTPRRGYTLDTHFLSVTRQLWDLEKYDEIFYTENLNQFGDFLIDLNIKFEICPQRLSSLQSAVKDNLRLNSTNSFEKYKKLMTKEAQEIILEVYNDDFKTFGYSTDFKDALLSPTKTGK
jgi:hypothetical protein